MSLDDNKIYSRIKITGLFFSCCLICLSIKLYRIMIIDNAYAVEKKYSQMYKPVIYFDGFEFEGDIYDRNNKKMTNEGAEYRAVILSDMAWPKIESKNRRYIDALNFIGSDNGISTETLLDTIEKSYKGYRQAIIMEITSRTKDEIEALNLPGIYIKEESRKFGDKVGFSIISSFLNNKINENDIKYDDSIDMKIFSLISRHKRRILRIPVDARGNLLPGLDIVEETMDEGVGSEAKDVVLTLDYDIQRCAEDTLSELVSGRGAVSVIDIKSGEVLAMASKDERNWERNMVTYSGKNYAYNPGSVFKTIVLAAALEIGGVDENTSFFCSGESSVSGISCYKDGGHGTIGLEDAFAQSCNVYFIELAKSIGAENIIKMAEKFGYGEKVLNFSRESKGTLYVDKKDIKYDVGNIAIGQKDIMVTPIQVCDMMSTIANNGVRKKPYILKRVLNKDGSLFDEYEAESERIVSSDTAKTMRKLLEAVVSNGTGENAKIPEGAAGKTGTPERGIKLDTGKYQYEDGWFAGYFPSSDPKYSVAVYIEDCGDDVSESNTAALVFKCLAQKIL